MILDSKCEVVNCKETSDIGWRYEGAIDSPRVEICWHHWRMHKSVETDWNLFDEFGYHKPPVKKAMPVKERIEWKDEIEPDSIYSNKPCACGSQKLRGRTYCPECAKVQKKESVKKRVQKHRGLGKSAKKSMTFRCNAFVSEKSLLLS